MAADNTNLVDSNIARRLTNAWAKLDPVTILQASWLAHIPFWLNILGLILLAKYAANFTWLFFTPDTEYKANINQQSQQSQTQARLSTVSRLHLFGQSQGNVAVRQANIVKTKLRLALKGVFASTNPTQAYAIIAESATAKGRTYKVGERLPSGATLHEVRANEVILNRNGRLESLGLPQKKLNTTPVAGNKKNRRRTVRTLPVTNRLKKIRETFVRSPQKFMENARLEPVVNKTDGSTEGFTFNHNDPSVMRSLGLLSSDVVTSINGILITTNVSGAYDQLLSSLKDGTPLSIEFKRKGIPQTVNVQM